MADGLIGLIGGRTVDGPIDGLVGGPPAMPMGGCGRGATLGRVIGPVATPVVGRVIPGIGVARRITALPAPCIFDPIMAVGGVGAGMVSIGASVLRVKCL